MLGAAKGTPRQRRLAGLLLLGGLAAAGFGLSEWSPVDQSVTLRLGDERAGLRSLDVAVLDGQGETLGGSRWNFSTRPPPPSLTLHLRAPRGEGTIRVTASREPGDESVREHRVTLDGSPLTLALRLEAPSR
jgi:hypothetical protein